MNAWLNRRSTPVAVLVVFLGSMSAAALLGVVGNGLMWGVYYLGWEDITPTEYMDGMLCDMFGPPPGETCSHDDRF